MDLWQLFTAVGNFSLCPLLVIRHENADFNSLSWNYPTFITRSYKSLPYCPNSAPFLLTRKGLFFSKWHLHYETTQYPKTILKHHFKWQNKLLFVETTAIELLFPLPEDRYYFINIKYKYRKTVRGKTFSKGVQSHPRTKLTAWPERRTDNLKMCPVSLSPQNFGKRVQYCKLRNWQNTRCNSSPPEFLG